MKQHGEAHQTSLLTPFSFVLYYPGHREKGVYPSWAVPRAPLSEWRDSHPLPRRRTLKSWAACCSVPHATLLSLHSSNICCAPTVS